MAESEKMDNVLNRTPRYTAYRLKDDGVFPNNDQLPLIVYQKPFRNGAEMVPEGIERIFAGNGWVNCWRNGLYSVHHYHSTAHEVLGVYRGWVEVLFGGEHGQRLRAEAGDVLVIPAGVSHKNIGQSTDFCVIGAYPKGQQWDMRYGEPGERPQTDINIAGVPLPENDPLFGIQGPLPGLWQQS